MDVPTSVRLPGAEVKHPGGTGVESQADQSRPVSGRAQSAMGVVARSSTSHCPSTRAIVTVTWSL